MGPSPSLTRRAWQQLCTHSLAQSPPTRPCRSLNRASVSPSLAYRDTCLAAGPGRGASRCGLGRAAAQARVSQASAAQAGSRGGQALGRSATRGSAGDGGAIIRLQGQRRRSLHDTVPATFPPRSQRSAPPRGLQIPLKRTKTGLQLPSTGTLREGSAGKRQLTAPAQQRGWRRERGRTGQRMPPGYRHFLGGGGGTAQLPGPPTQPYLGGEHLGGCT